MPKLSLSYFKNKHFLALAGNGVISVLTLVQMSLIYHKLEVSDVGTWVIFLAILGTAESIRNGFLSTATIKFYAGTATGKSKEVLGSVWYLALLLTGILVLVDVGFFAGLKYISDADLRTTIKWFGVTFISSLP